MNSTIDIENTNDYELIMLYNEEDENAKNILFYKYKFIIEILIKKYSKVLYALNIDYQEIYSECTVGFCDALRSYSQDKEASLPTFITLCVERRLMNVIKKYNREKYKLQKESLSLDFIYENNQSRLMDFVCDDDYDPIKKMVDEEDYKELFDSIKKELTSQEYEALTLVIKGFNYLDIAKILNKDPKQIDNSIQRAKNKIKKIIKKRN